MTPCSLVSWGEILSSFLYTPGTGKSASEQDVQEAHLFSLSKQLYNYFLSTKYCGHFFFFLTLQFHDAHIYKQRSEEKDWLKMELRFVKGMFLSRESLYNYLNG